MNRQKKIYQKVKKRLQQEKAKNQPVKKPRYIPKAEREALENAEKAEKADQTQETAESTSKSTDES